MGKDDRLVVAVLVGFLLGCLSLLWLERRERQGVPVAIDPRESHGDTTEWTGTELGPAYQEQLWVDPAENLVWAWLPVHGRG